MDTFKPGTLVSINGITRTNATFLNGCLGIIFGRCVETQQSTIYIIAPPPRCLRFGPLNGVTNMSEEFLTKKEVISEDDQLHYMRNSFVILVQKMHMTREAKEAIKTVLDICAGHPNLRWMQYLDGILAGAHGIMNEQPQARAVLQRMIARNEGKSLFANNIRDNMPVEYLQEAVEANPTFVSRCQLVLILSHLRQCKSAMTYTNKLLRPYTHIRDIIPIQVLCATVEEISLRAHKAQSTATKEACLFLLFLDSDHDIANEELLAGFHEDGRPTTIRHFFNNSRIVDL